MFSQTPEQLKFNTSYMLPRLKLHHCVSSRRSKLMTSGSVILLWKYFPPLEEEERCQGGESIGSVKLWRKDGNESDTKSFFTGWI